MTRRRTQLHMRYLSTHTPRVAALTMDRLLSLYNNAGGGHQRAKQSTPLRVMLRLHGTDKLRRTHHYHIAMEHHWAPDLSRRARRAPARESSSITQPHAESNYTHA